MNKYIPVMVPDSGKVTMKYQRDDNYGLNDFCIIKDDNGLMHIFAITWFGAPNISYDRPYLAHATSKNLFGEWKREPYMLLSDTNNWAPHVIRDHKDPSKFLMFLGGMAKDTLRVYEADSKNLFEWTLRKDFGQSLGTRDPMLIYVESEKKYYMYTTMSKGKNPNDGIGVCTSTDLEEWTLERIISLVENDTCDESPFVVEKDGYYYLWATWSSRHFYKGIPTRIFRSEYPDFRDISDTGEENAICSFPIHAVEIIEEDGQMYIGQTGTGGPGIVFSKLRWGKDGNREIISTNEVTYHGNWNTFNPSEYAGMPNRFRFSDIPGGSYEYTFTGFRIEIRGFKSINGGMANVYIDNKLAGEIDMFGYDTDMKATEFPNAFLWTSEDLDEGEHTLRVVVQTEKHEESLGHKVNLTHLVKYSSQ